MAYDGIRKLIQDTHTWRGRTYQVRKLKLISHVLKMLAMIAQGR